MRRKAELCPTAIDRGWPHYVAGANSRFFSATLRRIACDQAAFDFLRRHRRWAELRNHVARNGRQPGPGPQMAMFDPGGFEPRPSSSKKRRFHVEVDHHGLGVLPRAITILRLDYR